MIRPAAEPDVPAISAILTPYAEAGLLLPRSAAEIRNSLHDFLVAESDGRVVGCVSLRWYGPHLVEVRSLAVARDAAGRGIGSELVRCAVRTAEERGARRAFALTRRPTLFRRLGFRDVPKHVFPEKVWNDCVRCPHREHCDEIALVLDLGQTPASA